MGPYIDMSQPRVYMCPPFQTPLPPPSPSHPSRLSKCTGFECPVSCIKLGLETYFTYDDIHVSMVFSQTIPPSPSSTESKSLFFTSASLLLSCIYGHRYYLSYLNSSNICFISKSGFDDCFVCLN